MFLIALAAAALNTATTAPPPATVAALLAFFNLWLIEDELFDFHSGVCIVWSTHLPQHPWVAVASDHFRSLLLGMDCGLPHTLPLVGAPHQSLFRTRASGRCGPAQLLAKVSQPLCPGAPCQCTWLSHGGSCYPGGDEDQSCVITAGLSLFAGKTCPTWERHSE